MGGLKRSMGLSTTISIVVGGVIGSGIFMKPSLMASQLGSPLVLLSVWLVAGCVSLFGALSNCELATLFPETGGPYVFFKKIYGDLFAFVYAWAAFAVINTAGNASIAYVCAQYSNYFIGLPRFGLPIEHSCSLAIPFIGTVFPLENIGVKTLTVVLLLALSAINYHSAKEGGALQRILTLLKVLAMAILIGGILFSGKGSAANIVNGSAMIPGGWALVTAYMAALSGAFWAYDGWNNITFVAGEIEQPQKNIPRGLFTGLFTCVIIYALINLAYSYILPIGKMAASSFVASDAATAAWGAAGGSVIALLVILSTLGAASANVLATARTTYAMADQNKWFAAAGKIHPKFLTPANAIVFNLVWSTLLIFTGSFDMLTDMLVFVTWFFYGMSTLGVFILRKRMPDAPRNYKVWGYPLVPAIFLAFVSFYLGSTLYTDITRFAEGKTTLVNSVLGLAITCAGIPVYYLSRRRA
jgi:basic amino acid/polyamine antiporter, APA family